MFDGAGLEPASPEPCGPGASPDCFPSSSSSWIACNSRTCSSKASGWTSQRRGCAPDPQRHLMASSPCRRAAGGGANDRALPRTALCRSRRARCRRGRRSR